MDMNADQIRAIVAAALNEGWRFSRWAYFLAFALAFAGSYFGAYAKRKAENLATKEDFEALLAQVKKTTEETEKIKTDLARISWVDQQRWTLKRELYMELLDSLYSEKEAVFKLSDEEKHPIPYEADLLALRENFIRENQVQSLSAIKRISKVRGVAGVLLTEEAQMALDEIALAWYESIEGRTEEFYTKRLAAVDKAYSIVLLAATKDLDIKSTT